MMLNELEASIPHTRFGRRWRTSTFRWLMVYALVFSISCMALLTYIEYSVTQTMERQADTGIRWQLRYFDTLDIGALSSVITRRIEREHFHADYYGLFAADGRKLAGDIPTIPEGLKFYDARGEHTLFEGETKIFDGSPSEPEVRAIGERRLDGTQLVVGRDLADVMHIRDELVRVLIIGSILSLCASFATGVLLSIRQMRRVAAIQRVTLQIAQGDLKRRLPIKNNDELDMLSHLVNHMLDEVERLMNEVKSACDGIAHDLRTPLAHVRTLLGKIADRAQVFGDEPSLQLISQARRETESLLERFRAMLRISEISALQRKGGFENVDLGALVEELVDLYQPLAEEKQLILRMSIAPVKPILGDRALLFEAFSNLVDNAIKFTAQGGEITVALSENGAGASVVVSDNGPGIPVVERSAVLQRFFRGEKARQTPGVGLGLGIVSAVMRMHDFDLRVGGDSLGTRTGTTMTIECWPHSLESQLSEAAV